MLMHVNRQTPAGDALKLALDETRVDWTTKELTPLPGFDSRYAVAGPDSRHDDLDSAPRAGASHATRRGSKSKGKGRDRSRSGGRGNTPARNRQCFPGWETGLPRLQQGQMPKRFFLPLRAFMLVQIRLQTVPRNPSGVQVQTAQLSDLQAQSAFR